MQAGTASATQTLGDGAIAVLNQGDHNSVVIHAGQSQLQLDPRHCRGAPATEVRHLLLAERRAIDLAGRAAELASLTGWLESAAAISVRCVTGRGGAGKTRLAIEFCASAAKAGWKAGFFRYSDLRLFAQSHSPALWRWRQPSLIVVDYAAASADILREWLGVLARFEPGQPKLRMLLLERHADPEAGWWKELIRPGGLSGEGPDSLFDPVSPVPLNPLAELEDRRAVLTQAMGDAARLRGIVPAPAPPPPGTSPDFDRRLADNTQNNEPLYLLMAGLVAVDKGAAMALSLSRIQLAERFAAAERHRLDRMAKSANIDQMLFRYLAACVTLQGGCEADDATRLVNEERAAFGDRTTTNTSALLRHLADALPVPASDDIDAVRPDLIGEAFLYQQLTDGGRKLSAQCDIVARAFDRNPKAVVTTIIRTTQNLAGVSATHPTVAWLEHVANIPNEIGNLSAILDTIPYDTLALRDSAADINGRLVALCHEKAITNADGLPDLARKLNNFSLRLSALGRREAALDAVERAAAILRDLAASRPDAFLPDLACSLNNLSIHLSSLGRVDAALDAIEQAVAIYSDLAASSSRVFLPDLACSLNNLSSHFANLGRREAALAAIEQALAIRRDLADLNPSTFLPVLADSLANHSIRLSELGQRDAALESSQQAVAIYRNLTASRPDAFLPNLAISLNNLSAHFYDLGRREAALEAIEQALAIHRNLASSRPDAFLPDLGRSLANFSANLAIVGRLEPALEAVEEAVAIYRDLAASQPAAFLNDLSRCLNNLSNRLSALGQHEAAMYAIEEAVAIRRDLAASHPDAFLADLAGSLGVLAGQLDTNLDRENGLRANAEAIAVMSTPFLSLPKTFGQRMFWMVQAYLERCENLEREPDAALLAPILGALTKFIQLQEKTL